jgi:hypothetical protein
MRERFSNAGHLGCYLDGSEANHSGAEKLTESMKKVCCLRFLLSVLGENLHFFHSLSRNTEELEILEGWWPPPPGGIPGVFLSRLVVYYSFKEEIRDACCEG